MMENYLVFLSLFIGELIYSTTLWGTSFNVILELEYSAMWKMACFCKGVDFLPLSHLFTSLCLLRIAIIGTVRSLLVISIFCWIAEDALYLCYLLISFIIISVNWNCPIKDMSND